MTDEAFVVLHMLRSFTGREIDLVDVHSIGVPRWSSDPGCLSQWNEAVSPTLEFSELYHVSVELSCLIKPLFPFPGGLSVRRSHSSHHDSELVGYPSLKGVHRDAIEVNSAACLGQSEGGGILVEVTVELVHV